MVGALAQTYSRTPNDAGDSTLGRYALQAVPPIHIIVEHGAVTLEGVVANEADKNMAALKAKAKIWNKLAVPAEQK